MYSLCCTCMVKGFLLKSAHVLIRTSESLACVDLSKIILNILDFLFCSLGHMLLCESSLIYILFLIYMWHSFLLYIHNLILVNVFVAVIFPPYKSYDLPIIKVMQFQNIWRVNCTRFLVRLAFFYDTSLCLRSKILVINT